MKTWFNYRNVLFLFLSLSMVSCVVKRIYDHYHLRQNYTNLNEILHKDPGENPFFKVHFKNGDNRPD